MPKKKKPVYKFGWSFGGTEPDSISSSDANIRFATPEKAISDLVKWITDMLPNTWQKMQSGEVVFHYLVPTTELGTGYFQYWYSAPVSDFAEAAQTVRRRGNLVDFIIFGDDYGLQFSPLVSDTAKHKIKNLIDYYIK